jgi:acetylornithine/N-succinyldiaminopimelate aminotransferase
VIVLEQAFHGRTLATLSATGNRKIQAGFEPLVSGFVRAPFNDIAAVRKIASQNPDVVAVLMEPIQGEGGVRVADTDYLQALRQLCSERQWLLMLDEVQTGNGRTGSYFAYQQLGFLPDVVTTAKGLGNGVPIGACLARGEAARVFAAGHHGSTYGGNPLVCSAGNAVVETIRDQGLAAQAAARGKQLREHLAAALAGCEQVVAIRGRGLMVGVELRSECGTLVSRALERGLLINVTAGNTIRLLPPLVMGESDIAELADGVAALVQSHAG